ncbi:hypothetical protein HN789_06800 [archaeon]|jgi:hypothetical protein|nr:hypothetical protein [archaeon]MBT4273080.1 hypothetical protein [archaeon]MBT4461061.1 hypothetical protein [archaeon]MBT4858730.1 hypothetical protein [archaeon]MBT5423589.1 hypothetical protein [archaeon]
MGVFQQWVMGLESLGLLDVLLPFLLIFTITFAVLQKSKILGDGGRRFNIIIAFVLAMSSIIPHIIGRGPDVVIVINKALPNVSVLMVASMMVLLLIGVFGKDVNIAGSGLEGWVVIFSIIAVAYTFLVSSGLLARPPGWLSWIVDPHTRSLLVSILVFGIIVWFITKDEKPEEKRRTLNETVKEVFGGAMK